MSEGWRLDQAVADLVGKAHDKTPRLPTGYSLDDTVGKMGPGELALMWARSGSGKSTWMLNVIANSQETPTVIFNMEMAPTMQAEWLTCMSYDLELSAWQMNAVLSDPEDTPERQLAVAAVQRLPNKYPYLAIEQPDSPTLADLARTVDLISDEWGVQPARVFIDHLGWMKGAKDYEGVIKTTRDLKVWAENFGITVIVVQQTTRGGDEAARNNGHIPVTLSSGVYGGEDAADWIVGMYRRERDPKFQRLHGGYYMEPAKYEKLLLEYESVRGITRLQVIKNRVFGEVNEEGIPLKYDSYSRRLVEESK